MNNFNLAKAKFIAGISSLNENDFLSAEQFFIESLFYVPNRASSLINLAISQIKLNKLELAEKNLLLSLNIEPNSCEAYLNLGLIDKEHRQWLTSLVYFEKSLFFNPNYPEAICNKANVLVELKRYAEALDCYNQAISLNPKYVEAYCNKGNALYLFGRHAESLDCYNLAISLNPKYADSFYNKANILVDLKRHDEALDSYNQAIALNSNYAEAKWNKAALNLKLSNFYDGWQDYETRWALKGKEVSRHANIPSALLNANSLRNKTVLVWSEQGFGDLIQFVRFVHLFSELEVHVILEVPHVFKSLFAFNFPFTVLAIGESFQSADYQIPIGSLPLFFKIYNLDLLKGVSSLLKVPKKSVSFWRSKLDTSNSKLNIGLACFGNQETENKVRHKRSIPLQLFSSLINRCNCFLIQKELNDSDRDFFLKNQSIHFLGEAITSFEDTAGIVMNMDLIITIDTSLAHLAGALNVKTFLLLPYIADWRWGLDPDLSIWYPSIKLFRQSYFNNWEDPIGSILSFVESQQPSNP